MLKWLNAALVSATIAAAFVVTWIKHDTRRLEARIQAQERQIEKAENDIAILNAELGFLTRPERIDPLARKYLGMAPPTTGQIVTIEQLGTHTSSISKPSSPKPGPSARGEPTP